MPVCTRPGCGKDQASDEPCMYHPGAPRFWEGRKSWSCCEHLAESRPVLDFADFLALPGCTLAEEEEDEEEDRAADDDDEEGKGVGQADKTDASGGGGGGAEGVRRGARGKRPARHSGEPTKLAAPVRSEREKLGEQNPPQRVGDAEADGATSTEGGTGQAGATTGGPKPISAATLRAHASSSSSSASASASKSAEHTAAAAHAKLRAAEEAELEQGFEESLEDPGDDVGLVAGARCRRRGCGAAFEGGERRRGEEQCRYHRGVPIFHDSSKGWSCCKRRVLDWDDFVALPTCRTSEKGHLFVVDPEREKLLRRRRRLQEQQQQQQQEGRGGEGEGEVRNGRSDGAVGGGGEGQAEGGGGQRGEKERGEDDEHVDCRLDWYETPSEVHVTVYAKAVDEAQSRIEIQERTVDLDLVLANAAAASAAPPTDDVVGRTPARRRPRRRHVRRLTTFSRVDAANSSCRVGRVKVELTLRKLEAGESWPVLESGERVVGFGSTFGRG